jgi:hypothetical protein
MFMWRTLQVTSCYRPCPSTSRIADKEVVELVRELLEHHDKYDVQDRVLLESTPKTERVGEAVRQALEGE